MTEKQFMSGSELRQYLHISTRKMKYLMDNNYIPHENTGHTTHKYRVRTEETRFGAIQYCAKAELITFMASPQRLAHPRTEKYKELIREFKYIQRRERENEQRRQKKMMKERVHNLCLTGNGGA